MKILFYYAWGLDTGGGAEVSILSLAEALVRCGHLVGILEMVPTPSKQKRMAAFGGPIWSMSNVAYPGRRPRTWASFLRSLLQFQSVIWEFKPDIVSVQFPVQQSIPVVGAYVLPHKWRLVATVRGSDIGMGYSDPLLRPWVYRLFKRADAVTAVSHSLWQETVEAYPIVRQKGRVIHNGVGSSWFQHPDDEGGLSNERYVLFVGRFDPVKGVDILLRAWKLLPQALGISLRLVGGGKRVKNFRSIAQELGIAEQVRFVGWLPQQDLPSWYRNAELVVIPSRHEGLPRVALEAGACGAICVASRIGGIPEVIEDNVNGFLVEPESPERLATALMRALQLPPEDRQRMSKSAQKTIQQHFTHERTTAGFEELFQALLKPSLGSDSV